MRPAASVRARHAPRFLRALRTTFSSVLRTVFPGVLGATVVLVAAGVAAVPAPARCAELVNRILLRVNDRIATLYDYERRVAQRSQAIQAAPELDPQERARLLGEVSETVMSELFEELLILSRADQLGIVITDFELQEVMAEMRERNGLQDDRQFQLALAQAGMTVEDLRDQYRREQARMHVVGREVRPKVELKDEALRRIYRNNLEDYRIPERIRVREVVVLEGAGDQALAERIHEQLAAGDSLEQIRERHGQRLSDILEVGWVAPGDLDAVLEAAVWDLEVGQFSEPVRARGGLHIVEIREREESRVRPFEEVQEQLYREEFGRRISEELEDYLERLQRKAFVNCVNLTGVDFCQTKVHGPYRARQEPREGQRFGLDEVDRLFSGPLPEREVEDEPEEIDWGEDDDVDWGDDDEPGSDETEEPDLDL